VTDTVTLELELHRDPEKSILIFLEGLWIADRDRLRGSSFYRRRFDLRSLHPVWAVKSKIKANAG